MITRDEILMGRDKEYPLTEEMEANLADLLWRVNGVRRAYGKALRTSSGYRPGHYNTAKMAKASLHKECKAWDAEDPTGEFAEWCLNNLNILEKYGLWMEDPRYTKGWVHLDTKRRKNRVFIPY